MTNINVTIGGTPDSALAQATAGMSIGDVRTMTIGVPNISPAPGASILEYCSNIQWDSAHDKYRFVGCDHGTGSGQYCEYIESGNDWDQETIPDGRTDPRHSYAGYCCDPVSGTEFYFEGQTGDTLWKRTNAGVWTSHTCPQAGWAQIAWNPTLERVVIGQVWGIRTFNPADNTFGVLRDTPAGTDMTDGPGASTYNLEDDCTYVGNTSGSNPGCWKTDGTGTCTKIANCPIPLAVQSAGNNNAMLCGTLRGLRAIRQDCEVRPYNSGADSWGSAISMDSALVSWIQGATNNQWIAGYNSTYDVIQFFRQVGDAMDTTSYIWRNT